MADEQNPIFGTIDEPEWALESTQKEILARIKDLVSGKPQKKSEDILRIINKNIEKCCNKNEKLFKNLRKGIGDDVTKNADKQNKKTTEAIKTSTGGRGATFIKGRQTAGSDGPSRAAPTGVARGGRDITRGAALRNLLGPTSNTLGFIAEFARGLGIAIPAVFTFGLALNEARKYVTETVIQYKNLLGYGQDFGSSLLEMRRMSADLAIGFDSFTKVMSENSKQIKIIGVQNFVALNKRVRDLNHQFGQFGLTTEQIAQFTAQYVEQQQVANRLNRLTQEQQSFEIQRYMFNLRELSKITGRHRDELLKTIQSQKEDIDVRQALALMSKNDAETFADGLKIVEGGLASLGPEFSEMLTKTLAKGASFGNLAMTDFGRVATQIGGQFGNSLERMMVAVQNGGAGANEALADMMEAFADPNIRRQLAQLGQIAGDEAAAGINQMLINLDKMSDQQQKNLLDDLRMSDNQRKSRMEAETNNIKAEQEFTQRLLNTEERWRRAIGFIEKILVNTLGPIFVDVTNALFDFFEDFDEFAVKFKPITDVLGEVWDSIISVLSDVASWWILNFTPILKNFTKEIDPIFNSLKEAFNNIYEFWKTFFVLLDELGVVYIVKNLANAFGDLLSIVYNVISFFTVKLFGALADGYKLFSQTMLDTIKGIRRLVYRIKNPTEFFTSDEEIDKKLNQDRIARQTEQSRKKEIDSIRRNMLPSMGERTMSLLQSTFSDETAQLSQGPHVNTARGFKGPRTIEQLTEAANAGDEQALELLRQASRMSPNASNDEVIRIQERMVKLLEHIAGASTNTARNTRRSAFSTNDDLGVAY